MALLAPSLYCRYHALPNSSTAQHAQTGGTVAEEGVRSNIEWRRRGGHSKEREVLLQRFSASTRRMRTLSRAHARVTADAAVVRQPPRRRQWG